MPRGLAGPRGSVIPVRLRHLRELDQLQDVIGSRLAQLSDVCPDSAQTEERIGFVADRPGGEEHVELEADLEEPDRRVDPQRSG
jgi:hypothetical protein